MVDELAPVDPAPQGRGIERVAPDDLGAFPPERLRAAIGSQQRPHLVAARDERADEPLSEEATRSGDEGAHVPSRYLL